MRSERKVPGVECQLQYNQADVGLFVRTSPNTNRQMLVCLFGRAPIQSGRRGFESLEGSVLDEAQYNQAYEVMNELHTINRDRYIIAVDYAVKSGGYTHVQVM